MSNLKCPFCGKELTETLTTNPFGLGRIDMAYCKHCSDKLHLMPLWDWQELIRTRKALDVAVDALKTVRRYTAINQFAPKSREAHIVAKKAVAKITALEQKD